ncbi:hypothetical protein PAESOLCIP111_01326 [Paenibacillus solanacearum]|uniref:Tyr recombinase domain-containing protein n=1 Tax=Paenibacillus solanacearum TaxID=2048548 RepID=A0A916JX12_9BACL|nr:tyrosine-type recombinase/integrase [Paenibacillus solanacearum]CAG7611061.1 hypothetical protein PAESOLCIP111_01326 [Paenibacillus solanacearum]
MKQPLFQKVLSTESGGKIFRSESTAIYEEMSKTDVREKFASLKQDGIVVSSKFEDLLWDTKDGYNLNFIQIKDKELLRAVRTYAILLLGQQTPKSVQKALGGIINCLVCSNGFQKEPELLEEYLDGFTSDVKRYNYARSTAQFLCFLNYEHYEEYIEVLRKFDPPDANTRTLVDFSDLLFFSEVLNDFEMNSEAERKMSFFPVILWWRLTNIIPMRPSEFAGIKTDCLSVIKGRPFITIPRKKLDVKTYGALEKEDTLPINDYIYGLVSEAQNIKRKIGDASGFLFSKQFINYFGKIKHRTIDHWTGETQLTVYIHKFYDEIVSANANVSDDLQRIKPGDTRHYAFINMRLQGFNPLTIARMGGHARITTQNHYFKHLNEYSESYVYTLTRLRFLRNFNSKGSIIETNESAVIRRGRTFTKDSYQHYFKLEPFGACVIDLINQGCVNGGDCRGCPHFHLDIEEQRNPKAIEWLTDYSNIIQTQINEQISVMNQLAKNSKFDLNRLTWYAEIDDDFEQKDEGLVTASNNLKSLMKKKSMCDAIIEVASYEN